MSVSLILGSSHALHFANSVGVFTSDWEAAGNSLIPIETKSGRQSHLLFAHNRPGFLELRAEQGRPVATFGPLMEQVRAYNHEDAKVVLTIGGNEHNARFMYADPRPFDFYHPDYPAMDPTRQVLRTRDVRDLVLGLISRSLAVTQVIARELPRAQLFYLPPPPPIGSDAQIKSSPEVFDFSKQRVESAAVRRKIYAIYLEAIRSFCQEQGIGFLAPVAANCDADGFLLEEFYAGSTHARPAYYDPIVSELGL